MEARKQIDWCHRRWPWWWLKHLKLISIQMVFSSVERGGDGFLLTHLHYLSITFTQNNILRILSVRYWTCEIDTSTKSIILVRSRPLAAFFGHPNMFARVVTCPYLSFHLLQWKYAFSKCGRLGYLGDLENHSPVSPGVTLNFLVSNGRILRTYLHIFRKPRVNEDIYFWRIE